MTEAEKIWEGKCIEVAKEYNTSDFRRYFIMDEAACHLIEEFEAFKQEVSNAVEAFNNRIGSNGIHGLRQQDWESLNRFVIAKPEPDPLIEALDAAGLYDPDWIDAPKAADTLRKSLAKHGLKIVEVDDD